MFRVFSGQFCGRSHLQHPDILRAPSAVDPTADPGPGARSDAPGSDAPGANASWAGPYRSRAGAGAGDGRSRESSGAGIIRCPAWGRSSPAATPAHGSPPAYGTSCSRRSNASTAGSSTDHGDLDPGAADATVLDDGPASYVGLHGTTHATAPTPAGRATPAPTRAATHAPARHPDGTATHPWPASTHTHAAQSPARGSSTRYAASPRHGPAAGSSAAAATTAAEWGTVLPTIPTSGTAEIHLNKVTFCRQFQMHFCERDKYFLYWFKFHRTVLKDTFEWHSAVQYNTICHTALCWLDQNINQCQITNYTTYLALTGELSGVFCEDPVENSLDYNSTALYCNLASHQCYNFDWKAIMLIVSVAFSTRQHYLHC